ncbi:MAG: acyl-CoA/acyl-ACP dehydrogenase [Mycobacteriaceae bacterium]|nr:acyl-CoA/acyl-ACP dehydrogenase [Mycobacteriaceae bacterium]
MDFSFTEAQQDLAGLARSILTDWADKHEPRPLGNGYDAELWAALAKAGLLDAALPQSVGGGGFGLLEQCSVLLEVGRVVAPAPYLAAIAVSAAAIAEFGGPAHAERWVLPVLRGTATLAPALDAGIDAERTADGWRLSGAQTAVPAGSFADAFVIAAAVGDHDELIVVDRNTTGLTVTPQQVTDGGDAALLELDDVTVGADAALGAGAADWARRRATIAWCALQLGVVERALEITAEYARTRKQFDKVIGSFQAVRQRLADGYLDVEAVRLTLWQAAWRESEGLPADAEIATAKFWAAEAGHRVAHTTVHVHGGVGIDLDAPAHRYFVAAKRAEFSMGGSTRQLRRLGAALAHEPA